MSDLVGDARHLSPSAQEALRVRAVAALVAGQDREDVAAVFGLSLKAVDICWAKWQAGGREALVMRPRGKPVGVHQVLRESEQVAVRQAVLDHRPCDVRLSGQLWTRWLIGDLIAKLYRVRLTDVGVGKYLKRWGLSFQRPDKRAAPSTAFRREVGLALPVPHGDTIGKQTCGGGSVTNRFGSPPPPLACIAPLSQPALRE
ncbi:helix-turn-helix domain-containing protein [Streptomyces griseoaurantiacus]|uniref:helix-turn-helix domain-containing protein n=1 Tax=Streptomyces griseoaurantiacus TaxID=68213 RepID=UPI003863B919